MLTCCDAVGVAAPQSVSGLAACNDQVRRGDDRGGEGGGTDVTLTALVRGTNEWTGRRHGQLVEQGEGVEWTANMNVSRKGWTGTG